MKNMLMSTAADNGARYSSGFPNEEHEKGRVRPCSTRIDIGNTSNMKISVHRSIRLSRLQSKEVRDILKEYFILRRPE